MMATLRPGHPVIETLIGNVLDSIREIGAERFGQVLSNAVLPSFEVDKLRLETSFCGCQY
jgi:hypothetical protein